MRASQRAVARLSQYRDILQRFQGYGTRWIFSNELASAMGSTAAQVRKDFSQFSIPGKKKVGYEIDNLITHIDALLRKDGQHRAVIAGLSMMGVGLVREHVLSRNGFEIVAAFDPAAPNRRTAYRLPPRLPVYPVEKLIDLVTAQNIQLGIIATADHSAQRYLDMMAMAGIRAVLNLSPIDLKAPRSCAVHSLNIVRELEKLVYVLGVQGIIS